MKRSKFWKIIFKLTIPSLIVLAWHIATTSGHVHPLVLPKLKPIVMDFIRLIRSGDLIRHVLSSLGRYCTGFVSGSLFGIIFGMLLGWSKVLEELFDFVINFLRSIPKTALAPLFIVWFGFGDLPKIMLIGLSSFFFTVIATIEGVKNVENILIKSARSMGANNRQILGWVILPAAMPSIYAGVRLAATTGLVVLVFVEILGGNNGLGRLLEESRETLNISTLFMCLIIFGILGYSLDWLVRYSEKKLMPWRRGKTVSL